MFAGATTIGLTGCSDEPQVDEAMSLPGETVRHSLEAAESYLTMGQEESARSILSKVIEQSPQDGRAFEMMGRLELRRGIEMRDMGLVDSALDQFKTSYEWYEQALRYMDDSAGLHQSAGEVAQLAGLDATALSLYESAMRLEPSNPKSSLCAAQLLMISEPARAESILRTVLEAHPEQSHALASLALVCQLQDKSDEANELAARALALAGDQVAVRVVVARVQRLSGRERQALELLLALPDDVRSKESTASEIAASWQSIGQYENAGQAWADCFKANAYRVDAWRYALLAAECMAEARQEAMAASWLEQAVMLDAPTVEVEEVRSRIANSNLFSD